MDLPFPQFSPFFQKNLETYDTSFESSGFWYWCLWCSLVWLHFVLCYTRLKWALLLHKTVIVNFPIGSTAHCFLLAWEGYKKSILANFHQILTKFGMEWRLGDLSLLASSNYQILPNSTPNSSPKFFLGDELGKNLIYWQNWSNIQIGAEQTAH